MILRPWNQIKKYKQLCDLLYEQIALLKQQIAQEADLSKLQASQVEFFKTVVSEQHKKLTQPPPETKMPLPDVGAVERLVSDFFENESVTVAQEAAELTRPYAPMGAEDVRATKICLMKLWRVYSMRKLEQAAKQDVL